MTSIQVFEAAAYIVSFLLLIRAIFKSVEREQWANNHPPKTPTEDPINSVVRCIVMAMLVAILPSIF